MLAIWRGERLHESYYLTPDHITEGHRNFTPGKTYRVAGMAVHRTVLRFIVRNDTGSQSYPPAGYFEVIDAALPPSWYFQLGRGARKGGRELWADPLVALWGYKELACDSGGLDALREEEPEAVAAFNRETELGSTL